MRIILQDRFKLLKEGKIANDVFVKEANMLYPSLIKASLHADDAISILKRRNIIFEDVNQNTSEKSFESEFQKFLLEVKNEAPKDAKAVEKQTSKQVEDSYTRGHNFKDNTNPNNISNQQFMNGMMAEYGDPKNDGKTYDQFVDIVVKNLMKDPLFYVKNSAFGIKGIGYTDEAPGLKASKTDQMTKVELQNNSTALKSNSRDVTDKIKTNKIKDEMTTTPKSQRGIQKMDLPGKEKKIKINENQDKLDLYSTYTYTLDGKTVKPDDIGFYDNLLGIELDGKVYRPSTPDKNGNVELRSHQGKRGMFTESEEYQTEETYRYNGKTYYVWVDDEHNRFIKVYGRKIQINENQELTLNDKIDALAKNDDFCSESNIYEDNYDERFSWLKDNFNEEDITQMYDEVFNNPHNIPENTVNENKDTTPKYFEDLESAKKWAEEFSSKEGVGVHINQHGERYVVEDWFDSDNTVSSYENGNQFNESTNKPFSALFEEALEDEYYAPDHSDREKPENPLEGIKDIKKYITNISDLIQNKLFMRELEADDLTEEEAIDFLQTAYSEEDIQEFHDEVYGSSETTNESEVETDEEEWEKIKQEVMDEFDVNEEDMNDDSTEDEVNRETDERFIEKFNREPIYEINITENMDPLHIFRKFLLTENQSQYNKITYPLVLFLDKHKFNSDEIKDYDYVGEKIENYAENNNIKFSDEELLNLAKQYYNIKSKTNITEAKKVPVSKKIAEIEKNSVTIALESKINAIDEEITRRSNQIKMVEENEDLSELVDKNRMKELQKEIKLLEKQKDKYVKLYEKQTGKKKQEVVTDSTADAAEDSPIEEASEGDVEAQEELTKAIEGTKTAAEELDKVSQDSGLVEEIQPTEDELTAMKSELESYIDMVGDFEEAVEMYLNFHPEHAKYKTMLRQLAEPMF